MRATLPSMRILMNSNCSGVRFSGRDEYSCSSTCSIMSRPPRKLPLTCVKQRLERTNLHATTAELHPSEQRMDACANGLLLERLGLPVVALLRAILRTSSGFLVLHFRLRVCWATTFLSRTGCTAW